MGSKSTPIQPKMVPRGRGRGRWPFRKCSAIFRVAFRTHFGLICGSTLQTCMQKPMPKKDRRSAQHGQIMEPKRKGAFVKSMFLPHKALFAVQTVPQPIKQGHPKRHPQTTENATYRALTQFLKAALCCSPSSFQSSFRPLENLPSKFLSRFRKAHWSFALKVRYKLH